MHVLKHGNDECATIYLYDDILIFCTCYDIVCKQSCLWDLSLK